MNRNHPALDHRWRTALLLLLTAALVACTAIPTPAPILEPTAPPTEIPSLRGIGGTLRILHPQAPEILNPHLSSAVKDLEASRITYEPLATYDSKGSLLPFLAEEIPSLENGGVAADGKSVTWKLKQGILWSDGEPFTADDVYFTYQFISNPEVNAASAALYSGVANVEVIDDYTVKVNFKDVTPAWNVPFVGMRGVILPRHKFEDYNNTNARQAPANILPVGTGPYRVVAPGIKPQEILLLGTSLVKTNKIIFEPNPFFRDPDKPYFSRIDFRGGGKPDEAARSLEKGEVDFVYDVGLLPLETLSALDEQGLLVTIFGSNVYRILLNHAEPNEETSDGERSSTKIPHRFFSDIRVRQAFAYAIDRQAIADLFGPMGRPVTNNLVTPPQFSSSKIPFTYDPEKAKSLLEEAGWTLKAGSKVREKDGEKLQVIFQSYSGAEIIAQNMRVIKENLEAVGVEVELKLKDASIMFGACATNPDSAWCFNADMMYFYINMASPDPSSYMESWTCKQIPQKANNWTGINFERWCDKTFDSLFESSKTEIDPQKRAQNFIEMNDLMVEDVVLIPTVLYADAQGVNPAILGVELTPWDAYTWNILDWRQAP